MFTAGKIIIADDHPLFRNALCQAIKQPFPDITLLECDTISGLERTLDNNLDTDLILLDLQMPGANGFSGVILTRKSFPEIPVIVVSASEDTAIIKRAIDYGASGFIPKSSDLPTISEAIQCVLKGDIWLPIEDFEEDQANEEKEFATRVKSLTPQQLRVFMMLTKGLLNKQIAAEINVSEATVRTHMTAIFRKLGVRNRTQAVLAANYLSLERPDTNH
ncbi:MAG: response regulator transcription factor [Pseudomonadales bacterium]|nr:response regulator transcription factor [Pseudomonadales bacterium]